MFYIAVIIIGSLFICTIDIYRLMNPSIDPIFSFDTQINITEKIKRWNGSYIDVNKECQGVQYILNKDIHYDNNILLWECSPNSVPCGGIGDQLRSMVALWIFSADRGFKFKIAWSKPHEVYPSIFDHNLVHWYQNYSTVPKQSKELHTVRSCDLFYDLPYIRLMGNEDIYACNIQHKMLSKVIELWKRKEIWRGCGFWALFKIGKDLKTALGIYENRFRQWLLANKYEHVVGIQIRFGDKYMYSNNTYSDTRLGVVHTMDDVLDNFIACAKRLEVSSSPVAYLLTTDTEKMKKTARRRENVYVNEIIPRHTGLEGEENSWISGSNDAKVSMIESFVELLMLSKSDGMVLSRSGFSITACELGLFDIRKKQTLTYYNYETCK